MKIKLNCTLISGKPGGCEILEKGAVVDFPDAEAKSMISDGLATLAVDAVKKKPAAKAAGK